MLFDEKLPIKFIKRLLSRGFRLTAFKITCHRLSKVWFLFLNFFVIPELGVSSASGMHKSRFLAQFWKLDHSLYYLLFVSCLSSPSLELMYICRLQGVLQFSKDLSVSPVFQSFLQNTLDNLCWPVFKLINPLVRSGLVKFSLQSLYFEPPLILVIVLLFTVTLFLFAYSFHIQSFSVAFLLASPAVYG